MAKNVVAQIFSLLLIIIFIDALSEYRRIIHENKYLIGRLKNLLTEIQNSTFDIFGKELINLQKIEIPKHANLWIRIIKRAIKTNQEIQRLIEIYSTLINPLLISKVSKIIFEIDNILEDTIKILLFQIQTKVEETNNYYYIYYLDSLSEYLSEIKPGTIYSKLPTTEENFVDEKTSQDKKLSDQFAVLQNKYKMLNELAVSFLKEKISFPKVLINNLFNYFK
jgi:Txe/YoeB family toxin of Txe-Axe toxin-antitoxin module